MTPMARTDSAASTQCVRMNGLPSPNGEVEGPPTSATQAPRAHTVFPRPRRVTTSRSRSPPTIVSGQHADVSSRDADRERRATPQ